MTGETFTEYDAWQMQAENHRRVQAEKPMTKPVDTEAVASEGKVDFGDPADEGNIPEADVPMMLRQWSSSTLARDHALLGFQAADLIESLHTDFTAAVEAKVAAEQERDEARALVTEANNSLYGSQGYFHSSNGGPFDRHHLARQIEVVKDYSRQWYARMESLSAELSQARTELEGVRAKMALMMRSIELQDKELAQLRVQRQICDENHT